MVQMSHFGIVFEFCFTVFPPPKAYILTARDLSKARPRRTMLRKNCSSDVEKIAWYGNCGSICMDGDFPISDFDDLCHETVLSLLYVKGSRL